MKILLFLLGIVALTVGAIILIGWIICLAVNVVCSFAVEERAPKESP